MPSLKKAVEDSLASKKKEFEDTRQLARRLQLDIKNKNAELAEAEAAVQKHTGELNTVKSNQAYRALLDEIEEAKKRSSAIEDEILKSLDAAEKENKAEAAGVLLLKNLEAEVAIEVVRIDDETRRLTAELDAKRSQREAASADVNPVFLTVYSRMLSAKGGSAMARLEGAGCGGCHMKLSVQNRNELERVYSADSQSVELVRCENCSRILYFEKGSR